MYRLLSFLLIVFIGSACAPEWPETVGATELTKWPDDKKAAISITYDDGIINQFTVARPIMNELEL